MTSAFIINRLLSDLLIEVEVDQKFFGTRKTQERFLKSVLKMKENLEKLRSQDNNRQSFENIYLEMTESQLNQAIDYITNVLKEA